MNIIIQYVQLQSTQSKRTQCTYLQASRSAAGQAKRMRLFQGTTRQSWLQESLPCGGYGACWAGKATNENKMGKTAG